MATYRKKPVTVEATQWFKYGDHRVVSGYRLSRHDQNPQCRLPGCGKNMSEHGWVSTLEGGHIVCPGDFIITGVKGEQYPCKPDIFNATYEPV